MAWHARTYTATMEIIRGACTGKKKCVLPIALRRNYSVDRLNTAAFR